MQRAKSIKLGDIFWVEDLPPLDGSKPSRHPVVVIDLADDDPVIVVGVTTDRTDPDRIDILSLEEEPAAYSGLPRRCCALPRWVLQIERGHLHEEERAGYLPKVTLDQLEQAVEDVLSEWPPKARPTPVNDKPSQGG